MNRFTKPELSKRIFKSSLFSILVFAIVLLIFITGISSIANSSVVNDKEILMEAIERDVTHCYCIEGMYPPSIGYMENHYGLTYDKDKFIIDYEYIGANIKPSIMILQK